MAYTETTRTSYGKKVKNSFGGIGSGILLIIIGTFLLWWNEGRAIKTTKALNEAQGVCVELPDINTVDPAFDGKLIHACGSAMTDETLNDENFGISVNAFKLYRSVEYFQWVENAQSESKEKIGGATETVTTYTYDRQWVSSPINSAEFKDPDYQNTNTVLTTVEDKSQVCQNATLGAYKLPAFIINSISGSEEVAPQMTEELCNQWIAAFQGIEMKNAMGVTVRDTTKKVIVNGNTVYFGSDPANPCVGDVRITFKQVTTPKDISIIAKVVNNSFEQYVAKNGKSVSSVSMGTVSAENMFESEHQNNKILTWILRILGIILVVGGFKNIFAFISTLTAVVPFIKNILGAGLNFVATVIGLIWSLLVIAIAWVVFRPVLGISLLAVAFALVVWLIAKSKKKKDIAQQQA